MQNRQEQHRWLASEGTVPTCLQCLVEDWALGTLLMHSEVSQHEQWQHHLPFRCIALLHSHTHLNHCSQLLSLHCLRTQRDTGSFLRLVPSLRAVQKALLSID